MFIKNLKKIPLNITLYNTVNQIDISHYNNIYCPEGPRLIKKGSDTESYEYDYYTPQPHLRTFYFNGETLRFIPARQLATYPYLTPAIIGAVHRNEARLMPNKIPYQLTITHKDPIQLQMFSVELTQAGMHHTPRLLINTVPSQLIIEFKSDVNLRTISSELIRQKIPYTIRLTPNTIPDHLTIKCNDDSILNVVEEELIAKKIPHYVENRYSLFTAPKPSIIVITGHDVKTLQDEHISHPHSPPQG